MAKKDTPLENHLYVTSYSDNLRDKNQISRLTELNYSHQVVMSK